MRTAYFGSYADGDFPPAPGLLMLGHLPTEVVEEFGHVYETVFNGTFVDFGRQIEGVGSLRPLSAVVITALKIRH